MIRLRSSSALYGVALKFMYTIYGRGIKIEHESWSIVECLQMLTKKLSNVHSVRQMRGYRLNVFLPD